MARRTRKLLQALGVVVMLSISVLVAGTTPADAATITISRTLYLDGSGAATLPYGSEAEIYVPAGWYTWTERLNGQGPTRSIYLVVGYYGLHCSESTSIYGGDNAVDTECELTSANPNYAPAWLPYSGSYTIGLSGPAYYTWTSRLTPQ